MHFRSLDDFAAHLEQAAASVDAEIAEAAKVTAERMLTTARRMYGQDPPLEILADATQEERLGLGYSANEPLLRDGALLRDSVEAFSTPNAAVIGTTEPIAAHHEYGFVNARTGRSVVPRPVFRYTLLAVAPFVREMASQVAANVLGVRRLRRR